MERERHGLRHTRLYSIWDNMKQRCSNSNRGDYQRYGERGIVVSPEWRESFSVFCEWALTHGYDEHLTIDRRNNDGNYCPENCRWIDRVGQMNNYGRNHVIEFKGKSQTLQQWANETGINSSTIRERLNEWDWTIEEALSVIPKHSTVIETDSGTMKTCSECQNVYPMTNDFFAQKKSTRDGFNTSCKKCVREYNKKYWKENQK